MSTALGVDWADEGWLCLEHESQGGLQNVEDYPSLAELWTDYDDGAAIDRLCIDIPIGLPTGPEERAVDKACRTHLDRKSSVFRVPVREALDTETPQEANNESRRVTGNDGSDGVGVQPPAYAIRKQILAVNEFVEELGDAPTETIYEVHPELCFTATLGDPPQYSKTTAHGVAERIAAINTVSEADEGAMVVGEALSAVKDSIDDDWEVTIDDVLDALVAMYTATAPDEEFHLLTGDDTTESPPRMAYRSDSPL